MKKFVYFCIVLGLFIFLTSVVIMWTIAFIYIFHNSAYINLDLSTKVIYFAFPVGIFIALVPATLYCIYSWLVKND